MKDIKLHSHPMRQVFGSKCFARTKDGLLVGPYIAWMPVSYDLDDIIRGMGMLDNPYLLKVYNAKTNKIGQILVITESFDSLLNAHVLDNKATLLDGDENIGVKDFSPHMTSIMRILGEGLVLIHRSGHYYGRSFGDIVLKKRGKNCDLELKMLGVDNGGVKEGNSLIEAQENDWKSLGSFLKNIAAQHSEVSYEIIDLCKQLQSGRYNYEAMIEHPAMWTAAQRIKYISELHYEMNTSKIRGGQLTYYVKQRTEETFRLLGMHWQAKINSFAKKPEFEEQGGDGAQLIHNMRHTLTHLTDKGSANRANRKTFRRRRRLSQFYRKLYPELLLHMLQITGERDRNISRMKNE